MSEFRFKPNGDWLQNGLCPSCNKKELFARADSPWVLKCGRANRCGHEFHVKDLYPDIFESWGKRFKPCEKNPNASADAYMKFSRGLDNPTFKSFYTQETYKDYGRDLTSATVRFSLPNGAYWERLIDQPSRFDRKAYFKKGTSYQGFWWQCPDQSFEDLARAKSIWICEGIFDALALRMNGVTSVSTMSTNNYPEKSLAALRKACGELNINTPEIVFAFDIGKAGTEFTKKYVDRALNDGWHATAAQPRPEGEDDKLDWNDLHQRGRLKPDNLTDYLWNGQVLLAETATEKAILLFEKRKWNSFSFVFDHTTWWANFNAAKIKEIVEKENVSEKFAARQCAEVKEIANCAFRILYYQRAQDIDETYYFLKITTPQGKVHTDVFAPSCLAAAGDFKKRLLAVGNITQYLGTTDQLDKLVALQRDGVKVVEALDFIGYSKTHQAYVLNGYAVSNGRVTPINEDRFYEIGKYNLKLRSSAETLTINYDSDRFETGWLDDYATAFGKNGLVLLVFFICSLFAEQIRQKQTSFPFLEMTGIPGTGKSTALVFLWKLFGRKDYEGFDPSKSSFAGTMRNFARSSNIPVVLMEGDRAQSSKFAKFDWNEIKPFFGGQMGRELGVRNGGTETYAPKFRASLIIEQNHPLQADPAVMERIIQTTWDKSGWSMATKEAATRIENAELDDLSGTIIHILKREKSFLEAYFAAFPQYEPKLVKTGVKNGRVRLNHAQLMAGLDAVSTILPIKAQLRAELYDTIALLAKKRDMALESDHEVVVKFWEAYDYIIEQETIKWAKDHTGTFYWINRSRKPDQEIAINLVEFEARCREEGITSPPIDELKKHLKSSKSRPFEDAKVVNGRCGRYGHCWVFKSSNQPQSNKDKAA